MTNMTRWRRRTVWLAALLLLWALGACGADCHHGDIDHALHMRQHTTNPVIQKFEAAHAGVKVDLFRAPTGQLNARVASDVRSGGLKADVIWACDPLTMQDYVGQGLVGGWTPQTDIPTSVRTPDYVGVAVLYLVAVARASGPALAAWDELSRAGKVAVPIEHCGFGARRTGLLRARLLCRSEGQRRGAGEHAG